MVNTLMPERLIMMVISMIDEMMTLLVSEQVEEDNKKAYYVKSLVDTDDEAEAPRRQITGHEDLLFSSEFDESVTNAIEIRQMQQAEFVTGRLSQVFETSRSPSRR